jgi:protein-disulfide isomerase
MQIGLGQTISAGALAALRRSIMAGALALIALTSGCTPSAQNLDGPDDGAWTPVAGEPSESGGASESPLEGVPAFMVKGDPSAPVVLEEWSDYQCPYCAQHAGTTSKQLDESFVDTGQVRIVFRDFPLSSIHEHAAKASEAARCAGELGGSDTYWAMHDLLFEKQSAWSAEEDAVPAFKAMAGDVGVDQAAFDQCLDEGRQTEAVQADYNKAVELGIRATPSFLLQGNILEGAYSFEAFKEKLDIVVAGGTLPTDTPEPTPVMVQVEMPSVDVDLEGLPMKGDPDAPVTIVEFSDYQCPYCKTYFDETYPAVVSDLVDSGSVRYVFFDLPLTSIHPQAAKAAEAAHCARDQGGDEAYFAMHDALFSGQDQWAGQDDPIDAMTALAVGAGLDAQALGACLEAGTHAQSIMDGFNLAVRQYQVGGTPTFVIGGQLFPGAPTIEVLRESIDKVTRGEKLTLEVPEEYAAQFATPDPNAEPTDAGGEETGGPEAQATEEG